MEKQNNFKLRSNLETLKSMKTDSVDVICVDHPFFSDERHDMTLMFGQCHRILKDSGHVNYEKRDDYEEIIAARAIQEENSS